ncbi:hypothetical protein CTAYLR_010808 [Chrysophaeum taylorii]|uniref:Sulfotransferase n=1 Tax=Chrysophaeum taylorii TaxID=2483200 RepID=A0AAD7UHG4_9STRA|nr:hypothetical protein CTAYLR_010808 [Chrysophaeum taylorii]
MLLLVSLLFVPSGGERVSTYGDTVGATIIKALGREVVELEGLPAAHNSEAQLLAPCFQNKFWSPSCVPASTFTRTVVGRFVLVVRDPRAVATAAYGGRVEGFVSYCRDVVWKTAALTSLRYYFFNELVRESHPTLVVFYEDLVAEKAVNEYYRIASFVELNPDLPTLFEVINKTAPEPVRVVPRIAKTIKTRSAESFFREAMRNADPKLLATVTRAMLPYLHPALAYRYLYANDEDVAILSAGTFNDTARRARASR